MPDDGLTSVQRYVLVRLMISADAVPFKFFRRHFFRYESINLLATVGFVPLLQIRLSGVFLPLPLHGGQTVGALPSGFESCRQSLAVPNEVVEESWGDRLSLSD